MEFIKNYNNNAALVKDDQGQEWIVTGKGVGFGLKPGMQVPEAKIERRFASEKDEEVEPDVVAGITPKAFEATDQIVKKMADEYQLTFTGYQYFALADHIDFAVKRTLDGGAVPDGTVAWEGTKLFPKEYRMAEEAVKIIEETTHIEMSKSEAVYLMYHFINAESDGTKLQDTVRLAQYITGIVNIIQFQYGMTLDESSFNYQRFVGHMRALMVRKIVGSKDAAELDPAILALMEAKYPEEKETVDRIQTYLQNKAGWTLTPDDRVYLILHIWRVTHREEEK
ncbi:PRD domain-containing protein [Lactobacillus sp.]|uniref:PRD domain-containing protein n=1 Tax=Lactobacillus sp. TaxID=1591 RepID=UPI003EF9C1C7